MLQGGPCVVTEEPDAHPDVTLEQLVLMAAKLDWVDRGRVIMVYDREGANGAMVELVHQATQKDRLPDLNAFLGPHQMGVWQPGETNEDLAEICRRAVVVQLVPPEGQAIV